MRSPYLLQESVKLLETSTFIRSLLYGLPASISKSWGTPNPCNTGRIKAAVMLAHEGRNGALKGSGTSLDGEPAPKQIRTLPPKELTDLLFVKSYVRSYIMQLFIELLFEKRRETKAQTDSSHFKASLKHLRMCGFFCLKPNFKTCSASKQVQTEQNINNAPLKGVMVASAHYEGDFASVMPVRRTCVEAQIDLPLYFLLLVLKKPCISYCCIC